MESIIIGVVITAIIFALVAKFTPRMTEVEKSIMDCKCFIICDKCKHLTA